MKKVIFILSAFVLIVNSCKDAVREQAKTGNDMQNALDTLIVKHENILNKNSYYYSRSYSYYWLIEKDTLDTKLSITEWKQDGRLSLRISHKYPILFTDALERINECLPLIKEDFDISRISSFFFKEPIYYLDLTKKLSSEYELVFGRKIASSDKLSLFLLNSSLTSQLNYFLDPLNKEVRFYGLEKFGLLEKKDYKEYLPNVDFAEYPEFTLNAYVGMDVCLKNK